MEQIGFRMQLDAGQAEEYKKRHDEIWPELVALLKAAGISDYSIFFMRTLTVYSLFCGERLIIQWTNFR